MADYNFNDAKDTQRRIVSRVQNIYKSLERDVVNYYYDKDPEDEDYARENKEGIRKYLRLAYEDIDKILDDLDKELDY